MHFRDGLASAWRSSTWTVQRNAFTLADAGLACTARSVVVRRRPRPPGLVCLSGRRSDGGDQRRHCRRPTLRRGHRTGPSTAWPSPFARSPRPGSVASPTPTTTRSRRILSRAPCGLPAIRFSRRCPTAIWRRAVRGDEAGVAAFREVARQHQMYMPFAEFIAVALLRGVERGRCEDPAAMDVAAQRLELPQHRIPPGAVRGSRSGRQPRGRRWSVLAVRPDVYQLGVRASHDWPTSVALAMAAAAIELGDSVRRRLDRARPGVGCRIAGSVLEQALRRSSIGLEARVRAWPWRSGRARSGTCCAGDARWRWERRCWLGCNANGSRQWSVNSECRPAACGP